MKIDRWLFSLLLIGTLLITSCTTQSSATQSSANASPLAADSSASSAQTLAQSPSPNSPLTAQFSNLPQLAGKATVEMEVKGGKIVIAVDGTNAPVTAGNFIDLVNRGVYDGLAFHRVVKQPQPFVVQGGDPQSKDANFPVNRLGTGGFIDPATNVERYIPLEIKATGDAQPTYSQTFESAGITKAPVLTHKRGAVAMARSQVPDSASSQFYFTLADVNFLDGSYAVFGHVTSGMEIIDQIQAGDRITAAKVTAGLENLKAPN